MERRCSIEAHETGLPHLIMNMSVLSWCLCYSSLAQFERLSELVSLISQFRRLECCWRQSLDFRRLFMSIPQPNRKPRAIPRVM